MRDLLASGGFRLRSATRADCARCEGRSRGTVSYNDEVAHCFRCGWAANRYQLAREVGHAEASPTGAQRAMTRGAGRRRARQEADIRAFAAWREGRLRQVSDRYWGLSRAALRAKRALASGALTAAEQELAWDALARFYHAKAELGAAFDLLMCAKASAWLEDDVRIEDLFRMWKEK
jgi:hypothetical protein